MTESEKMQIKGALRKCAKENENKITPTCYIVVSSVCRAGADRIEELEKENAELKKRNQELLKSCEGATMMYKDLQKAKEIIKKYLSIGVGGKITQNYLDVTKEAEQFIK